MFITDSAEDAAFRHRFRDWVVANLDDDMKGWSTRPPFEIGMRWYRRLAAAGFIAPHWPRIYGGMEASIERQIIMREELARAGAPEVTMQGINHIGPILMQYGTDAQKAAHLPGIVSGEIIWCQGYSEPGAGSDLASLRTRAEADGDALVITGQKIWTTWAHHSHWMFALVRTDPEAPRRQAGISFVLIDLASPGIVIRPIRTLAGDDELAEVFLDAVRVPRANLVGPINEGWKIANSLLAHERLGSANPNACYDGLERLRKVARATGIDRDAGFCDRRTQVEIDVMALAAAFADVIAAYRTTGQLGPETSMLKIWGSETQQRIADLLLEAAGPGAAAAEWMATPDGRVDVSGYYRQARRATIYGGTSEIQRNIIARRVLGLPG